MFQDRLKYETITDYKKIKREIKVTLGLVIVTTVLLYFDEST